ncbi:hypothetical protein I5535_10705 [Rhodobacteraceae bacterium F11138]|nr:hypothetical protein [Rhodobacteraceae bacterium F11138]
MKGSNSRFSHRPDQRYSNTAHVQGGMVTDADLTETGQIHQARDEAQNAVTVGSGSPARNGAVVISGDGPALAPGWIMAEGKQGQVRAASGKPGDGPLGLFADQADLPLGPRLPEKNALLYADLWERPVFAMQDPYLADPGLHGAETTYRTRTMTQIKSLRYDDEDGLKALLEQMANGKGAFARTGNALASVKPKNTEIAVDDCDPCADQIDIVPTVPNALFRIEVIRVGRNEAGHPISVRLAWSHENAAAIEETAALEDVTARDTFARAKSAYEFFSDATEAQIGWFDADHAPERPALSAVLHPIAEPGTGKNGGKPFSHVRRWDGACTLDLSSNSVKDAIGTGKMNLNSGTAGLTLDSFTLELALKDAEILAGDYWLVELRRFAAQQDRIRLLGGTDNKNALPEGVAHHFCALFTIEEGKPRQLSDSDTRRLSFPPLTDIPATHISFDPQCPDFFDNSENVAEALNSLCDLDATQVAYHPSDGCERFEDVKTVHQALEKMCKVQDDTAITRVLRLMMDWGVICGIRLTLPTRFRTTVAWSGGTILNRAGQLIDVKSGSFDLRELKPENIHGDLRAILEKDGEICLSMAAGENGRLELHLSDRATAFGPADRGYREAVDACVAGHKKVDFGNIYRPLKPHEGKVVESVLNVWANRKTLAGAVPLSETDGKVAKAVNKTLVEEYAANATPERAKEIQDLILLAEKEMNPDDLRGAARDRRRMQLEAAKIGILANAEEEDRNACECLHLLPPCPPQAGKAPYLVPVGCLKMDPAGDRPGAITELCALCCRKQALTWRAHRYFFGSQIDALFEKTKERCCTIPDKPNVGIDDWLGKWDDRLFEPRPDRIPVVEPEPDPLWPPKTRPDVIYDPGIVYQPDLSGKMVNVKPDVTRLPPATANEILTGNGYDVSDEVIDLDDVGDPLAKITEMGGISGEVIGKRQPEPGDKIAMMTSGGKVVDYVVIRKGSGKLPYETDAQTKARVEKVISNIELPGKDRTGGTSAGFEQPSLPTGELDAFAKRLDDLVLKKSETETEVRRLTEDRAKLAGEVGALQDSLRKSMADLEQIKTERVESEKVITKAKAELEEVRKAQEKLVVSLRKEQPVDVVLADNPNAAKLLRAKGIVSLADIEKQPTGNLTTILRRAGMNGTQIKGLASNFVKR